MNDTLFRHHGLNGLLSLILLAAAGVARAEVFRCEHEGRKTFTDTPCDAEAQPIEVAEPLSMQAIPGSDLATRYDERRARERRERIGADSRWLEQYDRAKADQERVRKALVEGRVVAGMSQQQVRQIWGEPSDVQLHIDQDASRERWVYRSPRGKGQGTRTVNFTDGRVAAATGKSGARGAGHDSKTRKSADNQKNQDR